MGVFATAAYAIAPPFVPDEQLAEQPIVVVARWDKSPLVPHHEEIEGNVSKHLEIRAQIVVERSIRGDVKPGTYTILLGPFIGWHEDGGRIFTMTSTMCAGDVDDVAQPNLWLLSRRRSWDQADQKEYLCLDTYRGVQPLPLEPYFLALANRHPEREVPNLLSSGDPTLLSRVLEYVSGGEYPWPFDPDESDRFVKRTPQERTLKPLVAQAPKVELLLNRPDPRIRAMAAAAYALLAKEKAVPRIRLLLTDKDPDVRAVAIGLLARSKDAASSEAINKAAEGVKEPHIVCKAIEALTHRGSESTVPTLIRFLQNDAFAYRIGDDLGVPALKARAALKKITGYTFPLDVRVGLEAWEKAKTVTPAAERLALLAKLAPCDPEPLVATIALADDRKTPTMPANTQSTFTAGLGGEERETPADITVMNRSRQAVTLRHFPSGVNIRWGSPGSGSGRSSTGVGPLPEGKEGYVDLAPGQSTRFRVNLSGRFMAAEPVTREITLDYLSNGNEHGVNAWIGSLKVTFGEEWKEPPHTIQEVEERWPNGNLKARGQLRDGQKNGLWTYYREDGKAVREEKYANGGLYASAGLNPDYAEPATSRHRGMDMMTQVLALAILLGGAAFLYRRLERAPNPPLSIAAGIFIFLLWVCYLVFLGFAFVGAPAILDFDGSGPGVLGAGLASLLTRALIVVPAVAAVHLRCRPRLLLVWCLSAFLMMPLAFFIFPDLLPHVPPEPKHFCGLEVLPQLFIGFPFLGFIIGPVLGLPVAWLWACRLRQ
jgi:hypothetical protein